MRVIHFTKDRKPRSTSKFGNVREDGFDSLRERKRYGELQLLERAGHIRKLRRQVRYELVPEQVGERAAFYIADFDYEEKMLKDSENDHWRDVVEDCKGCRTDLYKLKKKLMLWRYGIRIRET